MVYKVTVKAANKHHFYDYLNFCSIDTIKTSVISLVVLGFYYRADKEERL